MVSKSSVNKSITVGSNMAALEEVCQQLLAEATANHFDVDSIFGIHLALEEAFYNAVKHGNKQDTSKQVHIEYMITQEKYEIYIADDGDGFNPDDVPDPRLEENLYRTCGRGMLLMDSFMDVLEYNQKGNRVRMIKYKNKSQNES